MAGEKLIVLEAMKMEIAVAAPRGRHRSLNCVKGAGVGGAEFGHAAAGGGVVKLAIQRCARFIAWADKPSDVIAEVYDRIGRRRSRCGFR